MRCLPELVPCPGGVEDVTTMQWRRVLLSSVTHRFQELHLQESAQEVPEEINRVRH